MFKAPIRITPTAITTNFQCFPNILEAFFLICVTGDYPIISKSMPSIPFILWLRHPLVLTVLCFHEPKGKNRVERTSLLLRSLGPEVINITSVHVHCWGLVMYSHPILSVLSGWPSTSQKSNILRRTAHLHEQPDLTQRESQDLV